MFDSENTPYKVLGGEQSVRALAEAFYKEMDSGRYPNLRNLHPKSLKESEEKFFDFLSGWLGGPQNYIEKHGHPRLRMRHAPFQIGEDEVNDWLACMESALNKCSIDGEIRLFLEKRFAHVAAFMQNH